MKTIYIFLILLTLVVRLQSQNTVPIIPETVKKYIGIRVGYVNRQLLDEQKSALTYASDEWKAGLIFKRENDRSQFNVSAYAGSGNYDARHFKERWRYSRSYDLYGNVSIDSFRLVSGITSGNLCLSYLRKIPFRNNWIWLAGASLKEMLVYPDNDIGLLNSAGFYANLGALKELGRTGKFQANISFPIIALNSRLPWHNTATSPVDSETKTFFKKGTRLVGPKNFRLIDVALTYEIQFAAHWNIGAGYSFTWFHVPYYQSLKSFINSFELQTTYTF
jgi:hypothetical protein